jgi:hypothetical protein
MSTVGKTGLIAAGVAAGLLAAAITVGDGGRGALVALVFAVGGFLLVSRVRKASRRRRNWLRGLRSSRGRDRLRRGARLGLGWWLWRRDGSRGCGPRVGVSHRRRRPSDHVAHHQTAAPGSPSFPAR